MSSIKTFTFPNGCKVVYDKSDSKVKLTSLQIFCNFGSAFEPDDAKGAAHFIEHMIFKGTKNIPTSKELFSEYDKIGAYINATTTKRYTNYIIKAEDKYVYHLIHIMADAIFNSVFKKKEYEKERHVVIEENIKDSDNPEVSISDMFDSFIYKGSSYECTIDSIDYHKTGKNLTYEKVIDIYKYFYRPRNMTISIVTNISFDDVLSMIKKTYFIKPDSNVQENNAYKINFTLTPQIKIQYDIRRKTGLSTTHLAIGFRTCGYFNREKYILNLLKYSLSGTMSGRLFTILREKNGLTYSSNISTDYYENMGDFMIYVLTDPKKIVHNGSTSKPGVLPLIIDLLNDIIKHGITGEELKTAKGYIKGQMTMLIEDKDVIASHNGIESVLYSDLKQIVPFEKIYSEFLKPITRTEIHQVIRKYFRKDMMSVCILGEHLPSNKTIYQECEKFQH